ncbi:MAG: hypothetical protein H0U76_05805 [Ktedonobacteraceae bacterium]|nr:hypothetical protein [Ktedonobacteraceae bacterium]
MWKNRKLGTLLIANRPKSVVSQAVCPENVRHSVALGKTAQQRRLFVMFIARFSYSIRYFYARHLPTFRLQAALIRFVKVFFLLFLFSDGIFLCFAIYKQVLQLNSWFLCALLSILLAITLAYLLFDEILARCTSRVYKSRPIRRSPILEYEYRSSPMSLARRNLNGAQQYFPDTPLPSRSALDRIGRGGDERDEQERPLVRVLETLDMSSTNVEHFLDSNPPSSSFPPLEDDD